MSREALLNFLHCAEHSLALKRELKKCLNNPQEILKLATNYGFKISLQDFKEDDQANKIEEWFLKSKIDPIKKT
tara:strand:+ start:1894 stop:2115 length:222 start_codon:yes stop_codon:yes gene_type:complete